MLIDEKTGLEVLTRQECLQLLASHHLGRLGLSIGSRPMVLPVNYVLDGERIIFRTDEGTKFNEAVRGSFVALEIDDIDTFYRSGWSVVVAGRADEVTNDADRKHVQDLPLRPWARGQKSHWVAIEPTTITGRRIRSDLPVDV
ncbi:MAG TPA: pyridoxamine 5'-phosphate oxidase family protein [Acidimicrobiales bacterium]|jgi:nitroimidazol reductase NimA-like FMN-containing flavoprotein (pyridoxamine 5'-phosphate oxidase superfamily)